MVHGEGDAAAHVTDDQILLLVFQTVLSAVALGDLPLVQGVPNRLVGHLGQTSDASHVVELVHNAWVNGEGATSLNLSGYAQRDERPQVAGMVQTGVLGILDHLVVQFVDAAFDGFHQSAATHHHVEIHSVSLTLQFLQNLFLPIVELVHDKRIAAQFFERVVQRGVHQQLLVFKDPHLGRDHSRINS